MPGKREPTWITRIKERRDAPQPVEVRPSEGKPQDERQAFLTVLEPIIEHVPELAKLERTVQSLEKEQADATARVHGLMVRANEARESDLDREAAALNRGRAVPQRKEPEIRSQLEGAQRDVEVLARRHQLAVADRSRYVGEHRDELLDLLRSSHAGESRKVAESARVTLEDLLWVFAVEDSARELMRTFPEPQPENTAQPQGLTNIYGPVSTATVSGTQPRRGDIEGTLRYLISLGSETVVGEASDGDAA